MKRFQLWHNQAQYATYHTTSCAGEADPNRAYSKRKQSQANGSKSKQMEAKYNRDGSKPKQSTSERKQNEANGSEAQAHASKRKQNEAKHKQMEASGSETKQKQADTQHSESSACSVSRKPRSVWGLLPRMSVYVPLPSQARKPLAHKGLRAFALFINFASSDGWGSEV